MIIARIMGGLGNQMFQYAVGRALAISNATDLKLDLSHYSEQSTIEATRTYDLDIFNICASVASDADLGLARRSQFRKVDRVFKKLLGPKPTHFIEKTYRYDPQVLTLPDNTFLDGYFQTEKYFHNIDETLRADFTFKEEGSPKALKIARQIGESNSVCVHVRRTDYLTNSAFGVQDTEYYRRGENLISQGVGQPTYFVFSDDIEWCRENLNFRGETIYVSDDFGPRKFRDDLRLMSLCENYIISNSSFAWWAVWLNRRGANMVVAPKIWYRDPNFPSDDLIPKDWLRV